ncbi:MAG: glycosyltransferase family 39 protein [Terracidiphilus sp.]
MTPEVQREFSGDKSRNQRWSVLLWATSAVFGLCYVVSSVHAAIKNPLWMDEVLTVWLMRMPSVRQMYAAVLRGAQSTTPVYPALLHWYSKVAGQSHLALRLPSLFAVLATALIVFIILRRHLGRAPALFASCLLLESLSPFGIQVRPYALVTVCFASALLCWDNYNLRPSRKQAILIGFLLAAAVILHFYAVLLVPAFGLMECLRMIHTRRFRLELWFALFLAGASIFVWLPLIRATSHLVGLDIAESYAYGAMPTWSLLVSTYAYLFQGWGNLHLIGGLGMNGLILLFMLAVLPFGKLAEKRWGEVRLGNVGAVGSQEARVDDFWALVLGSLLAPILIFLFAMLVTKSFNLRYVLVGAIGASALLAEVLGSFAAFDKILPAGLLAAAIFTTIWGVPSMKYFHNAPLYNAMPGSAPIVEADGSQFFQLEESAPSAFRSRLEYLVVPANVPVADAMNQHVIQRWKLVNPALPVEDMSRFLAGNGRFYVLDQHTTDDTPAAYLLAQHKIALWKTISGANIYKSVPQGPGTQW